jgi:hypothetical protein
MKHVNNVQSTAIQAQNHSLSFSSSTDQDIISVQKQNNCLAVIEEALDVDETNEHDVQLVPICNNCNFVISHSSLTDKHLVTASQSNGKQHKLSTQRSSVQTATSATTNGYRSFGNTRPCEV